MSKVSVCCEADMDDEDIDACVCPECGEVCDIKESDDFEIEEDEDTEDEDENRR